MKRLLILLVLPVFLFNWIGYQLYTSISGQNVNQILNTKTNAHNYPESEVNTNKKAVFHLSMYAKDIDFDDLLEFTSTPNYSVNEIFSTMSNDLFPDHAKENQRASFKCFNGEYYSASDKLSTKYPDTYSSGKKPDRYLFKITPVFLSPLGHPPQFIG